MNDQTTKRLKYEREALAEGVAVKTDTAGVILKVLAKPAVVAPRGRERCGELGPERTPRAKARAQYRRAPQSERKSGFKAWTGWMGISV